MSEWRRLREKATVCLCVSGQLMLLIREETHKTHQQSLLLFQVNATHACVIGSGFVFFTFGPHSKQSAGWIDKFEKTVCRTRAAARFQFPITALPEYWTIAALHFHILAMYWQSLIG